MSIFIPYQWLVNAKACALARAKLSISSVTLLLTRRLLQTSGIALQLIFSDIIHGMRGRKVKKVERPVFDSIRKPTAPPSQRFGEEKPEERVHPSRRKTKHKKKTDLTE